MGPPEESVDKRHLRQRNFTLDYNESDRTVLDQDLIYDCGFIKVTGVVHRRWKRMKEAMCMQEDEELVVHLLDAHQK